MVTRGECAICGSVDRALAPHEDDAALLCDDCTEWRANDYELRRRRPKK
jgi:hypothetical protein